MTNMDNKCENGGPLKVPGFGGIPLEHELPISERFAHGISDWKQVPAITIREFVMTAVMNDLTDKPGWQQDIFDEAKVNSWQKETLSSRPLLSRKAWDWCVAELKDKAAFFKEHDFVRVLDTGSCICKSDSQTLQRLSRDMCFAFEPVLAAESQREKDGLIRTYVDPSLHPLIYGKSTVLAGTRSAVTDNESERSHRRGTLAPITAPELVDKRFNWTKVQARMKNNYPEPWEYAFSALRREEQPAYFWSYKYQWLPSEVEFVHSSTTDVRLVSSISDLSKRHGTLYRLLEKLISLSIEPWNQCLIKGDSNWKRNIVQARNGWAPPDNVWKQRGRVPARVITYGVEWENEAPEWMKFFDLGRQLSLKRHKDELRKLQTLENERPAEGTDSSTKNEHRLRVQEVERSLKNLRMEQVQDLPEPSPEQWAFAKEYLERAEGEGGLPMGLPDHWEANVGRLLTSKVNKIVRPRHPEPGSAFSYQEWVSGQHGGRAVVDMVTDRPIAAAAIPPTTPHEPYTVNLREQFGEKGLQIIIRVEGVELNPGEPSFPGGTWQMDGQKNEHIVAIAMFAYDVHNVSQSEMSFRQETKMGTEFFRFGLNLFQDEKTWTVYNQPDSERGKLDQIAAICEIFGWRYHQMYSDNGEPALPLQEIGKVVLSQGRLVAFPNVMEYRREPFKLEDQTKSGHHRMVTLMLVDPNYRICSTRNILQADEFGAEAADGGNGTPESKDKTYHHDKRAGSAEAEKRKMEISQEHEWMLYNRYCSMGTFSLE